MEQGKMLQRSEAISFCLTLENVYEDYPFHDVNWCVMRHQKNQKVFAWIFDREDAVWINVKCSPEWRDFWRQTYPSILSEADIFYEYSIDGLIVRRKFLFLWFARVFDVVMVLVCVSQPKCSSPSVRGAGIAVMQYYGTSFLG